MASSLVLPIRVLAAHGMCFDQSMSTIVKFAEPDHSNKTQAQDFKLVTRNKNSSTPMHYNVPKTCTRNLAHRCMMINTDRLTT